MVNHFHHFNISLSTRLLHQHVLLPTSFHHLPVHSVEFARPVDHVVAEAPHEVLFVRKLELSSTLFKILLEIAYIPYLLPS